MKINWKNDYPGTGYSSMTGTDEAGNTYYMPANMETCAVELPDGRKASGWTPEKALAAALALPIPPAIENRPHKCVGCDDQSCPGVQSCEALR
jgi:hypothetical protein